MANNAFESIRIGLASPEKIRSWSHGEVTKPETINYRTLRPEKDGLFCEKIFGPTKDWECLCGKYKRVRYKGQVCDKCGVEVTTKKVRRERMGHIELAAPVSHIWYFKAIPSKMGLLLDMTPRALERVLYFMQYVVLDKGPTDLEVGQVLTESEYQDWYEKYEDDFRVGMGAEAIKELLHNIDIEALSKQLRAELLASSGQKKLKIIKRLEIVEGFRKSGNKPEWMILDVIPVIPPDLRPMVPLDGGRYATSDLNDLYRRVINRNNRLKKIIELNGPEIIIRNEKRMLQEAVDALIDNGRRGKPVIGSSNRELKSLSEMLRGKQGRFRQNLLGKRVDYSGRSVIVVGPSLKIYQCGLPKEMALELFKPFVMKRLVETQNAVNIKDAKKKIDKSSPEVWDALENVIKDHPVLLNRAPTLHRLSIQAFEPVLVEGRAIKLHPLVCAAFNADFDGDQMPIHVPLSSEAQAEARFLMLSANNFLKPVDGKAVTVPSQDMVLGSYYLTIDHAGEPGEGGIYRNFDEAMMAYENGVLGIHAPIKVRVTRTINGVEHTGVINATLGRLIFNAPIPQDLGFVDRSDPSKLLSLEIDFTAGKKQLGQIIDRTIKTHGPMETARVLDAIKENGYKYSTKASLSISIMDISVPSTKQQLLDKAQEEVDKIHKQYNRGLMTEDERYKTVIALWEKTTDDITNELIKSMSKYNPITMMSDSGARGSMKQMRQLAGMRGLVSSTTSRAVEIPIKTNFREGMNVLEYFIGAKGSRKALSDTALKTADSGYLTRRLVDVSQEVIVRELDCGTRDGIWVSDIVDGGTKIETLEDRLTGRFAIGNTTDIKGNIIGGIYDKEGTLLVAEGEMITSAQSKEIVKAGIDRVYVRSILKCKCRQGVCAHCYGLDLATSKLVSVGEAVGIIAAQSIGEPGTQLTMRTFHTGGVAGSDITQGLPRVEELFEARKPKKTASIAATSGVVKIVGERAKKIIISSMDSTKDDTYAVPYGTKILVEDGSYVQAGDALTEGTFAPSDISAIKGIDAAYEYLTKEVQRVYRGQDIEINDKHIEVITRQMTRKVRIEDGGDTDLLPASVVDVVEFNDENAKIQARIDAGERDIRPATATPLLLGITKSALQTESFLSAASFQETTRVLTEAAIKGKVDNLVGLKENVIIGKLIPAGTGLQTYRDIEIEKVAEEPIPGYSEDDQPEDGLDEESDRISQPVSLV